MHTGLVDSHATRRLEIYRLLALGRDSDAQEGSIGLIEVVTGRFGE